MKLLMIGADGVCPDYIFEHPEHYPNLTRLIEEGASAAYSAYVQKGYQDSYLSEMNWSSIHTGLAPWEHRIAEKMADGKRQTPHMDCYDGLLPFWEVLNRNGYTVGMWQADCCTEPTEIDGYVVSSSYEMIETPRENRLSERAIQTCKKDGWVRDCLKGGPPPRKYPKTLRQQGFDFEELKRDSEKAWRAVEKYHFQDAPGNFREELEYYYQAMVAAQEKHPVDMMYFYTVTTDLIGHCAMYRDQSEVLVEAYKLVDEYVGKWMDAFQPENIIVLSDHGMVNFKELVSHPNPEIQREAFGARDEVLWLKNGYIAFEAHNGALLFTAHGLKGLFIAAGKDVRHCRIDGMRTLDIYPAILELFGVPIPARRSGHVPDLFKKKVVNQGHRMSEHKEKYKSAAIIQTAAPDMTDIVINEIYLHDRFLRLTLVGEERYREIFEHNPRITAFVPYNEFTADDYDEIYCGVLDPASGLKRHVRIKG